MPYYEVVDGDPMLVVPYSKTYNDSRFLMNPGFASPRDFLDTMVMGLDELLREGEERRDDDDRRRARALERAGRAGRGDADVPRARDAAARRRVPAPQGHRPMVARHLPAGVTPLRAGIIGGGWIARVHVPAIDAAPGVELVAACDIDADRAEAIAGPRGARPYSRWEEMLEREELDVLWVCPPPLHHRAPVEAALAAGVHVYLEKPIARTLADADAIVAAAGASPAVCAVGYQWHASELLEEAREALRGQRIAMLVGRNFGPVAGRPWFMDQAQGGGQILERGSHHIDLQRALAGEVASVEALAGTVGLAQPEPGSVADAIVLVLHFASGAVGTIHSAWSRDGQPELYATDILATDATINLEFGPEAFRVGGVAGGQALSSEHGDPWGGRSRASSTPCAPATAMRCSARRPKPGGRSRWRSRASGRWSREEGRRVRLVRIDHVGVVVATWPPTSSSSRRSGSRCGR